MIYKAVILVGGPSRGTRFRPLSLNVPKPLFPIAGHPVIWHHLEALSKVEGVKEVLMIGFYEDSVFQRFIDDAARDFPQIYSLGTAGGLYHFRDEIQRNDPRQIFVLNADVACSFPLNEMVKFHNTHRGLCTILGTKKPENHEVLHYVEKPESFISNLISCGIYLFDCAIFTEMKKAMQNKANRVDRDQFQMQDDKLRLEQDILRPLTESSKLFVYETTDTWVQVKTPSSAVPANALYLEQYQKTNPDRLLKNMPDGPTVVGLVYKHPTATIDPTAKIGPNVTIGPRVIVGKGVRIKDSIILDNAEIKNNGCVLYSIIGWDSKVGNWSRVEGTPTTDHSTTVTQNGVKIQSISILAQEVTVKDEIIIRNCIVLPNKELKTSCHNEVLM
ncbi:10064_t:CDS:2 [Cetraspora pellucida]|uniref:mannose-1-phosphate guanylyltransferase n=1 Tax=Cetraspora pellucida TaxID=1433469 RepID=A0A9N9EVD3_9GLOM|nr:10064_t:CDS:2 [Cetraspora pellucida]